MDVMFNQLANLSWAKQWIKMQTGQSELAIAALVGHGAYGQIAKGLAWHHGWPGLAFDSSQFFDSPLSIVENWATGVSEGYGWTADFYSGKSMQVVPDDTTQISESREMPTFGGFFDTSKTEETFCMAVAGCAQTDRLDTLCESLVGKQEFSDMYKQWNRPRANKGNGP
jgi:hypothetical protein